MPFSGCFAPGRHGPIFLDGIHRPRLATVASSSGLATAPSSACCAAWPRTCAVEASWISRGVHRWLPFGGKKGGPLVGVTRRGKATKIMAVADRNGLPVACWIASGPRHETKLVVDTLKARFVRPLPKKLIGDRAYDSDLLDAELAKRGVEMIAPNLDASSPVAMTCPPCPSS